MIGLTDEVTEGHWVWVSDRSEVTWLNWAVWSGGYPEPDNLDTHNCAKLMNVEPATVIGEYQGVWGDYICSGGTPNTYVKKLVCQRKEGDYINCASIEISGI